MLQASSIIILLRKKIKFEFFLKIMEKKNKIKDLCIFVLSIISNLNTCILRYTKDKNHKIWMAIFIDFHEKNIYYIVYQKF